MKKMGLLLAAALLTAALCLRETEEEILRGIREAKDLSEYEHLAYSAYLRAKEDYLMGINFSRLLTLKYGDAVAEETCAKNEWSFLCPV